MTILAFGAACLAAFYAKIAAEETGRGADSAQSALRPWMLFNSVEIQPNPNGGGWEIFPVFKNFGQSPAINVRLAMSHLTRPHPEPDTFHPQKLVPEDCPVTAVIPNGGTTTVAFWPLTDSQVFQEWTFIECACLYINPHTGKQHHSTVQLRTHGIRIGDRYAMRWNIIGDTVAT